MTGDWGGGRSRGTFRAAASTRPEGPEHSPPPVTGPGGGGKAGRVRLHPHSVGGGGGGVECTLTRGEGPWVRPAAHTHTCTPGGRAQTQCTRTCGILEAQTEEAPQPLPGACESVTQQSGHGSGAGMGAGPETPGPLLSSWCRRPWAGSRPWAVVALPGALPLLGQTQHTARPSGDQSGNTAWAVGARPRGATDGGRTNGNQAPGLTYGAWRAERVEDRVRRDRRGQQGRPRARSNRDRRRSRRGPRSGRRGGGGSPRSEGRLGMGSSGRGL